jgi:hypothetical protein
MQRDKFYGNNKKEQSISAMMRENQVGYGGIKEDLLLLHKCQQQSFKYACRAHLASVL